MSLVNGTDFVLKINNTAIGQAKSASLKLNTDMPDATNKESGGFKEVIAGTRDALLFADGFSGATTLSFENLVAFWVNGTLVTFEFEYQNQTWSGFGYLQNIEEIANYEDVTAFDLEIVSSGIVRFSTGVVTQMEFVEGGNIEFIEGGDIDFVELS